MDIEHIGWLSQIGKNMINAELMKDTIPKLSRSNKKIGLSEDLDILESSKTVCKSVIWSHLIPCDGLQSLHGAVRQKQAGRRLSRVGAGVVTRVTGQYRAPGQTTEDVSW